MVTKRKTKKKADPFIKKVLGHILGFVIAGGIFLGFQKFIELAFQCGDLSCCLGCGGISGLIMLMVIIALEYFRM